jgi:hypothetical protein
MKDSDFDKFFDDLVKAMLFHRVEGFAERFKNKYRQEIIVLLDMLDRVGLVGAATALHPDPPHECDLCNRNLKEYRWFVDGQTASGEWANMCQPCFIDHGGAIGWGHGQLYLQVGDHWRLVSGNDPAALESEAE